MAFSSYNRTVNACVGYIADRITECACDNGDDPGSYSVDEEVVMEYLKELARDISKKLPAEVKSQYEG